MGRTAGRIAYINLAIPDSPTDFPEQHMSAANHRVPSPGPARRALQHAGRAEFKRAEQAVLRQMLTDPGQPIAGVRRQLEISQPASIAEMVLESEEFAVALNDFLRLLPPRLGARIVGDPRFSIAAAARLLHVQSQNHPEQKFLAGYWQIVSHRKLSELLLDAAARNLSPEYTLPLLRSLDRDALQALLRTRSTSGVSLLALLQNYDRVARDGLRALFLEQPDLFDFACHLAHAAGADAFLETLGEDDFAERITEIRVNQFTRIAC